MKKQWDNLWNDLEQFNAELQNYLGEIKLSPNHTKAFKPVLKTWERIKNDASSIDNYLSPVDPINISLPWDTEEFKKQWKFYIEYLQEQHSVFVKSRAQKMALKYLDEISESNLSQAIKIIEFTVYVRAKSFVIPPTNKKEGNNSIAKKIETDSGSW